VIKDHRRLITLDAHEDPNLLELGVVCESYSDLMRSIRTDRFRVILQAEPDQALLSNLFKYLGDFEDTTLFIDEIADWLMSGSPGIRESTMNLRTMIRKARKRRNLIVITTQRPAEVDKALFAACFPYIGRMHESNDLIYLGKLIRRPQEFLPFIPMPEIKKRSIQVYFVTPLSDNLIRVRFNL